MTLPVVILAGGDGRRMGGQKALMPFRDGTLIGAVIARLQPQTGHLLINVGLREADGFEGFGLPLLRDAADSAQLGPLSGVLSALDWAASEGLSHVITTPCDMPDLPADYVERLRAAPEAEVVYYRGARDHPLCARWRTSLAASMREALMAAKAEGGLAVFRFISSREALVLQAGDDEAFRNRNRPEDLDT